MLKFLVHVLKDSFVRSVMKIHGFAKKVSIFRIFLLCICIVCCTAYYYKLFEFIISICHDIGSACLQNKSIFYRSFIKDRGHMAYLKAKNSYICHC